MHRLHIADIAVRQNQLYHFRLLLRPLLRGSRNSLSDEAGGNPLLYRDADGVCGRVEGQKKEWDDLAPLYGVLRGLSVSDRGLPALWDGLADPQSTYLGADHAFYGLQHLRGNKETK